MYKNDKKFMFSKLPNRPEPSQISHSLTARLTSNGFDTAQHTVWETSAYSCYWVLILEPILLNFKINVLATLTSEGTFLMDLQIYWAPNLCGSRGSKVWFNSLKIKKSKKTQLIFGYSSLVCWNEVLSVKLIRRIFFFLKNNSFLPNWSYQKLTDLSFFCHYKSPGA